MIHRFVKLTFKDHHISQFIDHFKSVKGNIQSSPGCHSVKLVQSTHQPNVFFTYSTWDNAEALDLYRQSPFFKATWQKVKQWFSAPPEAWSTKIPEELKSF